MPQTPKPGVMTIPEKVIEYIGYSSAALEKAAQDMAAREAQKTKVAELIPAAVDALVSGERIDEDQREKAAAALADPVKVLEILTKVAVHRNASERALGQPVAGDGQTKQASAGHGQYDSLQDPNVGARTTKVKQSSVNLFSRLGLTPPAQE
jgi:hypothetical protein